MGLFVLRRLISGALVIVVLTFLTYLAVNEIPQNRACHIMACTQSTTKADKQEVLHRAGLDQSIFSQYGEFIWRVVRHASLGSAANGQALNPTIEAALPPTASLVFGGMVLMFLLTVPLAAYAASFPRSPADRGVFRSAWWVWLCIRSSLASASIRPGPTSACQKVATAP